MSTSPRRYAVLDRDGTINVERHYLSNPDELELLPEAAEGLKRLKQLGLGLIVITNQSAIDRGYFDEARLSAIHARLLTLLREHGVELDGIYHCPHRPDENCACRKPGLALAEQAALDLNFRLDQAFFIGDNRCDIEMGRRAGAHTILVRTGYGAETLRENAVSPDFTVDNLLEAAGIVDGLLAKL
jgi:D-glycero-D-manno-heptose 1,7-bisphosphate phosphatase